ncbi:hypothetical protein MTO96_051951 [Rhipicephalus appendiculatus]
MDRREAKRAPRRTQPTKVMNEAMPLLESDCNEQTTFSKVIDKLVASRDELRNIDAELEEVIPVKELEREYESVAHYDDQSLETLTRLRCWLEDVSLENTRQQSSTSARLNTPLAPTTAESQSFGPHLRTLTIKPFQGDLSRYVTLSVLLRHRHYMSVSSHLLIDRHYYYAHRHQSIELSSYSVS